MFKKDDFISQVIRDCDDSIKMYKKQIIKITDENILKSKEIEKLTNNWNELKEYIKEKEQHYLIDDCQKEVKYEFLRISNEYTKILDKMKVIKEENNEK